VNPLHFHKHLIPVWHKIKYQLVMESVKIFLTQVGMGNFLTARVGWGQPPPAQENFLQNPQFFVLFGQKQSLRVGPKNIPW